MHYIESFISAIGDLAGPLGVRSILCGAFASVDAMLKGKKFPQNVRALRMLLEEILRPILQPRLEDVAAPTSVQQLLNLLSEQSVKSQTTKA